MQDTIQLALKAKHFDGTVYASLSPSCDCAIEKALKEMFPDHEVSEGVDTCSIYPYGKLQIDFDHKLYDPIDFDQDKEIASFTSDPEETIRVIELKRVS